MLIASIPTNIVGILVFLFLFWKRLRDDYSSEIIFKTAFDILIGIGVGLLFSLKFIPGLVFRCLNVSLIRTNRHGLSQVIFCSKSGQILFVMFIAFYCLIFKFTTDL